MPYQIKKVREKYMLWKINEKKYVNKKYNTRQSAINAGKRFMEYRKEKPVLVGNRLLNKNKM